MNILEGLKRVYILIALLLIIVFAVVGWEKGGERPSPFDVAAAKAEGFSEREIADFLASTSGDDMNAVRLQGVTDAAAIDFFMTHSYQYVGKSYNTTGKEVLRYIPPKRSTVPMQSVYALSAGAVTALILAIVGIILQWIFTGFFPSTKAAK